MTIVSARVVCAAVVAFLAECNNAATTTCNTQTCQSANGSHTYQSCDSGTILTLKTGDGASCSCPMGDETQCAPCENLIAGYCAGNGAPVTCHATFTGAVTGTVSNCSVAVTYDASVNAWTIEGPSALIPGSSDLWEGFDVSFTGKPQAATYDQTTALGSNAQLTVQGAADAPIWIAAAGQGDVIGSARLTFTSLGPEMQDGNGNGTYAGAHGTFTATLADQNADTAQPDVTVTLTF